MSAILRLDVDQGGMPDPAVREEIFEIERKMKDEFEKSDAKLSEIDVEENVRHIFAPGVYAREMTILQGQMIVGKLHKTSHINVISKGDISVKTQFGVHRYKAPYTFVSQVGTKRVVFAHEDTIWMTIHPTDETELKEIEKHVIAESYDEIPGIDGPCLPSGEES